MNIITEVKQGQNNKGRKKKNKKDVDGKKKPEELPKPWYPFSLSNAFFVQNAKPSG